MKVINESAILSQDDKNELKTALDKGTDANAFAALAKEKELKNDPQKKQAYKKLTEEIHDSISSDDIANELLNGTYLDSDYCDPEDLCDTINGFTMNSFSKDELMEIIHLLLNKLDLVQCNSCNRYLPKSCINDSGICEDCEKSHD